MKVHFIGISGIGMSAAALLAKDLGFIVSGSADTENDRIVLLKNRGIEVFIGHRSANVKNPDMVVYTNAVSEQNEELKTVRAKEIPAFPRLIFLGRILPRYPKPVIGITGTDGKSTTTAMVAHMLIENGEDPTVLLGGLHQDLEEGNYRRGTGPLVMEVDESDGFLRDFSVDIACFTNIHGDHLEHYEKDFSRYQDAIFEFVSRARERIFPLGYAGAYRHFCDLRGIAHGTTRLFELDPEIERRYHREIPGIHNRLNASCALKVCEAYGLSGEKTMVCLDRFSFVDRRFSIRYASDRVVVIDDYAHTPREIESVLQAVNERFPRSLTYLVFEAHRYSRLEREFRDFIAVLSSRQIGKTYILPIYSAYEEMKPELFEQFVSVLGQNRPDAMFINDIAQIVPSIPTVPEYPVVCLFVGAGNSSRQSKALASLLERLDPKKVTSSNPL